VVRQLYHHTKSDVKEFWGFWGWLDWPFPRSGIVVGPICARFPLCLPLAKIGSLTLAKIPWPEAPNRYGDRDHQSRNRRSCKDV
jgi:hypothetical protein